MELEPRQAAGLQRYEALLIDRAVPLGAIARSDVERIRDRHILDSLRAVPLLAREEIVCDLGSGAGLPGIVVAIALPGARVLLSERREQRVGLLELAVQELELSNVEVIAGRAEDLVRPVDACLARAFAPLPRAWNVARSLLRPGGRLVYFAGADLPRPEIPAGAVLEAVVGTPVLESGGPLVIMARQ